MAKISKGLLFTLGFLNNEVEGEECLTTWGPEFHSISPKVPYLGTQNVARNGKACLKWNTLGKPWDEYIKPKLGEEGYIDIGDGNHNYCRVIGGDTGGAKCYWGTGSWDWNYCQCPGQDYSSCSSSAQCDTNATCEGGKCRCNAGYVGKGGPGSCSEGECDLSMWKEGSYQLRDRWPQHNYGGKLSIDRWGEECVSWKTYFDWSKTQDWYSGTDFQKEIFAQTEGATHNYCRIFNSALPVCIRPERDGDGYTTSLCRCPRPAEWNNWGSFGQCSVTCGGGSRTRSRTCRQNDGGECEGDAEQTEDCNTKNCPAWREWGDWGDCSATCDAGTQIRSRDCTIQTGETHEASSDCEGEGEMSQECNEGECRNCGTWYEGTAESGCYASEAGNCVMKNDQCADLQCSDDKMVFSVRSDAFGTAEMLKSAEQVFFHNDAACEDAQVTYDENTEMYTFTIPLGACGMTAAMVEDRINFSTNLKFEYDAALQSTNGIIVERDVYNDLTFTCSFSDQSSTDEENPPTYQVNRVTIDNSVTLEQLIDFKDFALNFFASEAFEEALDTDWLHVGSKMFMEASWTPTFHADFPGRFFVKECRVSSGDYEFPVIQNGCANSAVDTTLLSGSMFGTSSVRYSYLSFSFTEATSEQNQEVVCDVKICLQSDIDQGLCEITCD